MPENDEDTQVAEVEIGYNLAIATDGEGAAASTLIDGSWAAMTARFIDETATGEQWAETYSTKANTQTLGEELKKRFRGGQLISISQLEALAHALIASGEVAPEVAPPNETPVEIRERHRNAAGQFESFLLHDLLNDPNVSVSELKRRVGPELSRSINTRPEPVHANLYVDGHHVTHFDGVDLEAFRNFYATAPCESLKPKGGFITIMNGERLTPLRFDRLVEFCLEKHLL